MNSPIPSWTATCLQLPLPQHAMSKAASKSDVMAIFRDTVSTASSLIRVAKEQGAQDLILFPEFYFSGGRGSSNIGVVDLPGPEIELVQELARLHSVFIGGNVYTRTEDLPGRYLNTSFLIGRMGDILLRSYRLHTNHSHSPHDFWDEFLARYGIEGVFPVAQTELGNIAMLPSMELIYPETARMFIFRGAEILLHPTADAIVDQSIKRTRATENMAFVVSCNTSTRSGTNPFMEVGSKIIDWRGHVLSAVNQGVEGHCTSLIDIAGLRRRRGELDINYSNNPPNYLSRMRVEAFCPLYNTTTLFPPNAYDPTAPFEQPVDPSTSSHLLEAARDSLRQLSPHK